jgi:hypothetical protein
MHMAMTAIPCSLEFGIKGSIVEAGMRVKSDSLPIQDEPEGWL